MCRVLREGPSPKSVLGGQFRTISPGCNSCIRSGKVYYFFAAKFQAQQFLASRSARGGTETCSISASEIARSPGAALFGKDRFLPCREDEDPRTCRCSRERLGGPPLEIVL